MVPDTFSVLKIHRPARAAFIHSVRPGTFPANRNSRMHEQKITWHENRPHDEGIEQHTECQRKTKLPHLSELAAIARDRNVPAMTNPQLEMMGPVFVSATFTPWIGPCCCSSS